MRTWTCPNGHQTEAEKPRCDTCEIVGVAFNPITGEVWRWQNTAEVLADCKQLRADLERLPDSESNKRD
jgi:hypothetical protein